MNNQQKKVRVKVVSTTFIDRLNGTFILEVIETGEQIEVVANGTRLDGAAPYVSFAGPFVVAARCPELANVAVFEPIIRDDLSVATKVCDLLPEKERT